MAPSILRIPSLPRETACLALEPEWQGLPFVDPVAETGPVADRHEGPEVVLREGPQALLHDAHSFVAVVAHVA